MDLVAGLDATGAAGGDAAPYRIAIVGTGPRGLSVLERIAARLADDPPRRSVEIVLIDPYQVGCGRIWRTDQPDWFLMNTVAGEVSAFSGPWSGGPARPGCGPSLAQWWATVDPDCPGDNGYAPRALHGRYMQFVLRTVEEALPPGTRLTKMLGTVVDLEPTGTGYRLSLADGGALTADRVVLVTGHAQPQLTGWQRVLADFAADHPGVRYLPGDSAADLPLDDIAAGSAVGILGLGLAFYDVMAALTVGRGGRFVEDGGALRYLPSGKEPLLVAGSRGGMPVPARGRNQKHVNARYRHVLFTVDRVRRACGGGRVDFMAHAVPWLVAEIDLVYYATALRHRDGADVAAAFTAEVAAAADGGVPDVVTIAARYGVGDLPRVDLDRLARPFAGRAFADPAAFEEALLTEVRTDLAHAEHGNVDSPLKAALDVIRDSRGVIRALVDFSGLDPVSHQVDFLGWYAQRSAFLAAGPPRTRLQQVVALIEAKVLRIVGPDALFVGDPGTGRFSVSSPHVAGSAVTVDTIVDARIPVPDVHLDPAPLTRRLVARGIWTSWVNRSGEVAFDTGGVAVTRAPFHPIGRDGKADDGLYVLGIPTEHTRWFMQGGSSRPGFWTDFVQDADAIAGDALAPVSGAALDRALAGTAADRTPLTAASGG